MALDHLQAMVETMIAKANQSCSIQSHTETKGAAGETIVDTWSDEVAATSCWIQPAKSNTVREYEARSLRVTHTVYLGGRITVKDGWRMLYPQATTGLSAIVRKFIIVGMVVPGEIAAFTVIHCEEMDPAVTV